MARELISKKTRQVFREYFVGTTLSIIADEFDAAGIEPDRDFTPSTSGARRGFVEQHYYALDLTNPADARRLLTVFENVLLELQRRLENPSPLDAEPDYLRRKLETLSSALTRDGYILRDGRLVPAAQHAPDLHALGTKLDLPELQQQIQRIREAVDSDPALAIGTAKELVETTCKTILDAREVPYSADSDVQVLVRETRKVLGLLPADIPDAARGADAIRKLLSNLGTVAQGLAELRNLYGTGHGKDGKRRGLSPRHARLAVGAAATLATFLLETHEARE